MQHTIALRPWEMEDLSDLVRYADNSKIAQNLTDMFPHPYSREDGIAFIQMTKNFKDGVIFCVTINDEVAGSIGVFIQKDIMRRNAELGYWIAEPFWGKGVCTAAVKLMVSYGFRHFEIDRIYARPFGRNIASQKVLMNAGFSFEARFYQNIIKNGILEDELFFGIRKTSITI
mgnify:CR=1 FL=1